MTANAHQASHHPSEVQPVSIAHPLGPPGKRRGYDFYRHTLRSPRLIVAPMVDQSELQWRLLSRKFGAELCYTPMIHSRYIYDRIDQLHRLSYRDEHFLSHPHDRPCIAQFCGNDPHMLVTAALAVTSLFPVAAVDLNLGCPQGIAKRGHYGAFLMDDIPAVADLVRTLDCALGVPVTVKIRVFEEEEKTVAYARVLEQAGAQLITVHGRRREQKGCVTGLADWQQIRRVKASVGVPVFANGNILYAQDVVRCLQWTQCDGVMSAEGHLFNPCVFAPIAHTDVSWVFAYAQVEAFRAKCDVEVYPLLQEHAPCHLVTLAYLDECRGLVQEGYVKHEQHLKRGSIFGHLFKLLRLPLERFPAYRLQLNRVHDLDHIFRIVQSLGREVEQDALRDTEQPSWSWLSSPHIRDTTLDGVQVHNGWRLLPYWVLQPYIRPVVHENEVQKHHVGEHHGEIPVHMSDRHVEMRERVEEDREQRRQRRRQQCARKPVYEKCLQCTQPIGVGCTFTMCLKCCRRRLVEEFKRVFEEASRSGATAFDGQAVMQESGCQHPNHQCKALLRADWNPHTHEALQGKTVGK